MSIEELIELLNALPGRMVEAGVATSGAGEEQRHLATFSGVVEKLTEWSDLPQRWILWWAADGTAKAHYGAITVWRDRFEAAEVREMNRAPERREEEEARIGRLAEISIRQSGSVIELRVLS